MNEFFKQLKKRLTRKPSSDFDSAFWKRFDGEFASTERKFTPRRGFLPRWAFQIAAVLLVALIVKNVADYRRAKTEVAATKTEIPFEKLIEQAPLIEELDLFSSNVDFSELNDEEWKILLEGNG